MMSCEEAIKLIDGYFDGELDPITNQAIEQQLRDRPNCEQVYNSRGPIIRAVRNVTPYYRSPAELHERIRSSLREEIAERPMRNISRDTQLLPAKK
jgi:anti-sigma factor RsiW